MTAAEAALFLIRIAGSGNAYLSRAEALCAERAPCTVLGWTNPRLVARSLPLTLEQMNGLAFRYVRSDNGVAAVHWDCARVPRRDKAQCLRSGTLPGAPTSPDDQPSRIDTADLPPRAPVTAG